MKRGSGDGSALLVSMQLGVALAISMSAFAIWGRERKSATRTEGGSSMKSKIHKTDAEWKGTLTPLQYRVLRKKATEPAGSGRFNVHKEKGMYICGACGQDLFNSADKFESGSGWPSFSRSAGEDVLDKKTDRSSGSTRTEVLCTRCDSHLGHVFGDGPRPTGLRYCINSAALGFRPAGQEQPGNELRREIATFGAGCFWCTEAVLEQRNGVYSVKVGYMGGRERNPTYQQVSAGNSGHAEVAQIVFDPNRISYRRLLEFFWHMHDPTTLNRQGADVGTHYRSVIFFHSAEQEEIAKESLRARQKKLDKPIVTQLTAASDFYEAEDYHQDYFRNNLGVPYCRTVIIPKLRKVNKIMNTTKLQKDDKAPDFTLIDQDGKEFHLMSSGKKVLVYFYPRASTPGCTTQACALQDELSEFEAADVEIIGISPDDQAAQLKFAQEHDLTFPLLSDEDRSVAEAYGVWGEKSMYGKKVMGIVRSAFLIDEKGIIIQTWYEISPANTVPYLKKILGMS